MIDLRDGAIQEATARLCKWVGAGNRLPEGMDPDPLLAATWFVRTLLEPPGAASDSETYPNSDAYLLRVRMCLSRYLRLNRDDQGYIIGAREDGVWWRGDHMNAFPGIVDTTIWWKTASEAEKAAIKAEVMAGKRPRL